MRPKAKEAGFEGLVRGRISAGTLIPARETSDAACNGNLDSPTRRQDLGATASMPRWNPHAFSSWNYDIEIGIGISAFEPASNWGNRCNRSDAEWRPRPLPEPASHPTWRSLHRRNHSGSTRQLTRPGSEVSLSSPPHVALMAAAPLPVLAVPRIGDISN
jgi:hypothetical protein